MRCPLCVCVALSGLFTWGPLEAQGIDLGFYAARIETVRRNVTSKVAPIMKPADQAVLEQIRWRTPESWETNAFARQSNSGRRSIVINAGLVAVTEWIALAHFAEWSGRAGCVSDYAGYLAGEIVSNSSRVRSGLPLRGVPNFWIYARDFNGPCEGFAPRDFDERKDGQMYAKMMDAVIATVVLHEVAHHVLGHVESDDADTSQSRENEAEADAWAIRTSLDASYDLRAAAPLFVFLAATGGGSLEEETRSTHPLGVRRIRDMMVLSRDILRKSNAKAAAIMDENISSLSRMLDSH